MTTRESSSTDKRNALRVHLEVTAAFDAFDEPVSIFSTDGTYLHINPSGASLLGASATDLIGCRYLDLYPDLAEHPFHEAFTRVASGKSRTERLEFFYAPMDRWSSQRLHFVDGCVIVLWHDITTRKRAELALEESLARAAESERQYRAMIEWMPQLAWWAKADGFIDYYNPRWYEYTGTVPADMEGWGWQAVHDPSFLPSVMQRWQHSIATGEAFEMEFPLRRHDGIYRWFLTRITPMRNIDGEIIRWIGINTDIDDQKRALALVGDTLESMSDAFFLLDREWRIVLVNRNQENVSRTARADTVGRSFWEVFPEIARPTSKYWTEYHRVMNDRVDAHFEEYYAPLDVFTEVDAYPARDGGIAVFFRDVSERKRADRQRTQLLEREQAARTEAESASRAKDEFLAMLGHELRNPLAPILTALELLRQRGVTGERELRVIERQVNHLVRLVDDLLDVSRITRGKVELASERIELADVVSQAIEIASPAIEARQHRLITQVPLGLQIAGDTRRLVQVVSNLLTNAAKFTPPGGLITISAGDDQAYVVLRVTDTGVGIAPELLPHVFDLFVQGGQELDRATGGLGLGLTIVRRLVELHGGQVVAASDGHGHGTTFTVYLPAVAERGGASYSPKHEAPALLRTRAKSILVVDDNVDAAEMLAAALQMHGHVTRNAHDGPSALVILETFKPDVAVLDIGLPVMDGYELVRKIRDRYGGDRVRVIAVTGYGQTTDRVRAAEAGFDAHLVKPVDLEQLTALIDEGHAAKPVS